MLVADDAEAFAAAAVAAIRGRRRGRRGSAAAGLVQQRMLAPARRAVLGAALRAPLLLVPPAERACVLFAEAAERAAAHALIAALVRLRVVVHVVLLPAAEQPADEVAVMGWARAQGVFFYAGTAQEQWTALLAAAAAPPPSFAVAAYGSLADFGRQLRHPHCAEKPPGPRCVLAAARARARPSPAAPAPPARRWLRAAGARTPAARAVGAAARGRAEADESMTRCFGSSLLRAQRLPIVVATTGALRRRPPPRRRSTRWALARRATTATARCFGWRCRGERALLARARHRRAVGGDARALGAVAPRGGDPDAAADDARRRGRPAVDGDFPGRSCWRSIGRSCRRERVCTPHIL